MRIVGCVESVRIAHRQIVNALDVVLWIPSNSEEMGIRFARFCGRWHGFAIDRAGNAIGLNDSVPSDIINKKVDKGRRSREFQILRVREKLRILCMGRSVMEYGWIGNEKNRFHENIVQRNVEIGRKIVIDHEQSKSLTPSFIHSTNIRFRLKSRTTHSMVRGLIFACNSVRSSEPTFARFPSVACTCPESTKEGA